MAMPTNHKPRKMSKRQLRRFLATEAAERGNRWITAARSHVFKEALAENQPNRHNVKGLHVEVPSMPGWHKKVPKGELKASSGGLPSLGKRK
jgi:hypothetical protein